MTVCSMLVVTFFMLKKGPLVLQEATHDVGKTKKNLISYLVQIVILVLKVVFTVLRNPMVVYYLAYGVMSILALTVHRFLFAFHLTEILIRYSTLRNVIRAVYEPGRGLFFSFIFFIILTYIASLICFTFFQDYFKGNCSTTIDCFLNTFDYQFKANGGIGGWMETLQQHDNTIAPGQFYAPRTIFDNITNILINVIMVGVVAGMIIDTFGLLREQEEEKKRDVSDKCFICGIKKEVFDRQADPNNNFWVHIRRDHYLWNYLFFIAHLKAKDEHDYNGTESYVANKLKSQDVEWFPLNKASIIAHSMDEEESKNKDLVEHMAKEVDEIEKTMKEMQESYQALNEGIQRASWNKPSD